MNAIALEAGISRQYLYAHFDDIGGVIKAYAGAVFGARLVSVGLGDPVPGSSPQDTWCPAALQKATQSPCPTSPSRCAPSNAR